MTEKYNTIANQIISELEKSLPEKYQILLANFKQLISEEKYRASYAELDKVLHLPDWSPSDKLKGLVMKYQVIF